MLVNVKCVFVSGFKTLHLQSTEDSTTNLGGKLLYFVESPTPLVSSTFCRRWSDWDVNLTTYVHPSPMLRMSGGTPPLYLYAFIACVDTSTTYRCTVTFQSRMSAVRHCVWVEASTLASTFIVRFCLEDLHFNCQRVISMTVSRSWSYSWCESRFRQLPF